MIELTEEQSQAIKEATGVPAVAVDRRTNTPYVLLRQDVYERLKGLIYDDLLARDEELRNLLARSTAANGWDEPGMDAYDRYDEELAKRCQ